MAAILDFLKILNMAFCYIIIAICMLKMKKILHIDSEQLMLCSILAANYQYLSPLTAALLDFLKIWNIGVFVASLIDSFHNENEIDYTHRFWTTHALQYFSCKLSIVTTSNGSHIGFFENLIIWLLLHHYRQFGCWK